MRALPAVVVLILLCALFASGCSTRSPALPTQPNAPTTADNVKAYGQQSDVAIQAVAASVTVARDNADNPAIVTAETTVALSHLPPATVKDLAVARLRAQNLDPKEYAAVNDFGRKLLAQIDQNWARVETDQRESARVSALKDKRITDLTEEVARVKESATVGLWTATGAALVVIGGLMSAFVSRKAGLSVVLAGAFAGALPHFYQSEYFAWVAGSTLATCAVLGVWWFYDRVRDSVNQPHAKKRKSRVA